MLNEIGLMQDFHSADIEERNKDNFDDRDKNCTTIDHYPVDRNGDHFERL